MIFLILVLALILRLVNLNQSLWLDEAVQAVTAQRSFSYIFEELRGDFHPPAYHILMHFWVRIFGSAEFALRIPSVLFGVGTVYVVYLIGKFFTSQESKSLLRHLRGVSFFPLLAALFMATAPFHIYYSQEARPYALVTFLAACSMYFFLKEKWLGYIVSTSLALYSSYFVLFLILSQGLAILVRKKYSQLLYILVSLLFFLPWLPMFFAQIEVGRRAVSFLPEWGRLVNLNFLKALPLTFIKFSLGRITIFNKTFYAVVAGILFLIYGSIIVKGFSRGKKLLITFWFFIPIFSAWLISLFIPNYQPFRLLLVLPAFYLLLAMGISSIQSNKAAFFLFLFIASVSLSSLAAYYKNPYFWRENWRGVANFVKEKNLPIIISAQAFDWPLVYYKVGGQTINVAVGALVVSEADKQSLFEKIKTKEVFYTPYLADVYDPGRLVLKWLEFEGFVKIEEISFNQIPIWKYERSEQ